MINDTELSIVVPKVIFHQMEDKLLKAESLINELLLPGDNVVIVEVRGKEKSIMDKYFNWETIHYSEIEIKGGGDLIKRLISDQKYDYEDLIRRFDYYPVEEERAKSEKKEWEKHKLLDEIEDLKDKLRSKEYRKTSFIVTVIALSAALILSLIF